MINRPDEPQDDVDQIFARLRQVAPPADLTQRIMRALPTDLPAPATATPAAPRLPVVPAQRRRVWQWAAAIAGIVFVVMSVRLGAALADAGALDLLGQTIGNASTFWSAPGDFVGAFFEMLPWLEVLVTLAAFVVFWYSASALVERRVGGLTPRPPLHLR